MKHGLPKNFWIVVVLLTVLAVVHGVALHRFVSRFTGTVLVGVALLVLLAHSGILGSLYAMLVRRSRHKS